MRLPLNEVTVPSDLNTHHTATLLLLNIERALRCGYDRSTVAEQVTAALVEAATGIDSETPDSLLGQSARNYRLQALVTFGHSAGALVDGVYSAITYSDLDEIVAQPVNLHPCWELAVGLIQTAALLSSFLRDRPYDEAVDAELAGVA